jgi:hypothetical protein
VVKFTTFNEADEPGSPGALFCRKMQREMQQEKSMVRIRFVALSAVFVLVAAFYGSAIGAEVRVQGTADGVRVEARDATPAEILAQLGKHFALSFHGETASHRLTATFAGPLREVVKRVLEGYNYVISSGDDGLEVIVVSPESPTAVPAPRPKPRGRVE